MLKVTPLITVVLSLFFSPFNAQQMDETIKFGPWEALFDGKTTNGWHWYNNKGMAPGWTAENGMLVFTPVKGQGQLDIVTDTEYTNFELELEWKVSKKGNSGLFWGVKEMAEYNAPYFTGPEIQILDNERHPDAKVDGKLHQAGALYDLIEPSEDVCKPAESWNRVTLMVNHNTNTAHIQLNGTVIVRFEPHGPNWEAKIKRSKFGNKQKHNYVEAPLFGKFQTGKIALQDHGDPVAFRNIRIRPIL